MTLAGKVGALLIAALIASLPITFATELRLTYDANGNLVTGDGKFRVYNSLNQLAQVYNGSGINGTLLESYTYHPTEERILEKKLYYANGSVQATTYYISATFVRVVNATGTYDFTFVYQNGQLVAQSQGGTTLFIHPDVKGSNNVVTNVSGAVLEHNQFSPFGERLNSSMMRYGYEGKETDSVVGDTDFSARKYRPDWGMFTQPDTTIQHVYDPQQLNRYSFERNSPYNTVDPTGHDGIIFIVYSIAAIAIIVILVGTIISTLTAQDRRDNDNYISSAPGYSQIPPPKQPVTTKTTDTSGFNPTVKITANVPLDPSQRQRYGLDACHTTCTASVSTPTDTSYNPALETLPQAPSVLTSSVATPYWTTSSYADKYFLSAPEPLSPLNPNRDETTKYDHSASLQDQMMMIPQKKQST